MVCDEWIKRFDAEKRKKHHNGELAQLGERLLCTQEVSGSIPLFSTIFGIKHFRKSLTYYNTLRNFLKHFMLEKALGDIG